MLTQYSPEEIYKISQGLPQSLRVLPTSNEFLETVLRISARYDIDYPAVLSTIVAYVLLGLLNPEDLPGTLKTELKVNNETAKKITHEVRRFILAPVKEELSQLYRYEFSPIAKPIEAPAPKPRVSPPTEAPREDTYRESVEQ